MFMRKSGRTWFKRTALAAILVLAVVAVYAFTGVTQKSAGEQGLAITRRSVQRAAVQCYALEGVYPPTLEYLKQHYGVAPNEELYFIDFQYIAANLMPDITVLERVADVAGAVN